MPPKKESIDLKNETVSLTGDDVSFTMLKLYNASLDDARIADVSATGLRLSNANLQGARIDDVNLSGARLDNADLSHVRVSDAKIDGLVINGVRIDRLLMATGRKKPTKKKAR